MQATAILLRAILVFFQTPIHTLLQSEQPDPNALPDLTQHLRKAQLNTRRAIRALPHALDATPEEGHICLILSPGFLPGRSQGYPILSETHPRQTTSVKCKNS